MLPEGISIWNRRVSKEDHPHQNTWASLNPLRAWIEQKGKGRANLFFAWTGVTISSCPQTMILIGSWDLKSASLTPLAFLDLQPADNSSGDFYIYLSLTYRFCSSEELWLIQMGRWQRKYHWFSWVEKKKVKKLSWNFGKALVNWTKKTEATLSV